MSASGFASFGERFLGLGARVSFDAVGSASSESSGKSSDSFAFFVFILVDDRVTRLLGSGIEAGSVVFWRFGGMFAMAWICALVRLRPFEYRSRVRLVAADHTQDRARFS